MQDQSFVGPLHGDPSWLPAIWLPAMDMHFILLYRTCTPPAGLVAIWLWEKDTLPFVKKEEKNTKHSVFKQFWEEISRKHPYKNKW